MPSSESLPQIPLCEPFFARSFLFACLCSRAVSSHYHNAIMLRQRSNCTRQCSFFCNMHLFHARTVLLLHSLDACRLNHAHPHPIEACLSLLGPLLQRPDLLLLLLLLDLLKGLMNFGPVTQIVNALPVAKGAFYTILASRDSNLCVLELLCKSDDVLLEDLWVPICDLVDDLQVCSQSAIIRLYISSLETL